MITTECTKICSRCDTDKPIGEFYTHKKRGKFYTYAVCKTCHNNKTKKWRQNKAKTKGGRAQLNAYANDWRKRNSDKRIIGDRKSQLRQYGLTLEDFDKMMLEQDGKCAICGDAHAMREYLEVDHCHVTGKVRGLLCGYCNRALGQFGDNIDKMQKAIKYLKKYK